MVFTYFSIVIISLSIISVLIIVGAIASNITPLKNRISLIISQMGF